MKKIYIVFVMEESGKYYAIPETIKTGENLIPFCKRYNATTAHICESATEAHNIAATWNQSFINNGTSIL